MRLPKSLTTLSWDPRKLTLLSISQPWRYCGPSNYGLNFLLYWYAPWVFLWGRQCAFVFPIYVRKYRKYTIDRWIVVYTVCASVVISPLRQWLDSYAKTCLKMWHTFKHFIHMQYFCCRLTLLSSLYIELALVCCTNPDNVNCFGTIFPNLNFVFASICAACPVHIQSDQYRSCSTVNNVTIIVFGIMFMTATGLENSPQSFGVYTVSQSRSVVTSTENLAPDNSPQSIGDTPQWARGQFARTLLYQTGSKNGLIWNSYTCVNCVVP